MEKEKIEQYLRERIAEYQRDANQNTGNEHSYAEGRRDAYTDILNRFVARPPPPPKQTDTSPVRQTRMHRLNPHYNPYLKDDPANDALGNSDE